MKKTILIPYVVGTFLTFPIIIFHKLECLSLRPKHHPSGRNNKRAAAAKTKIGDNNVVPSGRKGPSVKRTCGQSQKDVRFSHSHK